MKKKSLIEEKEYLIPFKIKQYLLSLILPKCNYILGQTISSTYFQIALNINNQKNVEDWKKNSSWIYYDKISNNTGYNQRIIQEAIKKLKKLNLIESKKHNNKLNIFYLKNHNLSTIEDIKKFNQFINNELTSNKNKLYNNKYKKIFKKLDNELIEQTKLVDDFIINDINLLRKCVINGEKIYKGSSLFFIKNLAPLINNNNKCINLLSEDEQALYLGVSQSTVNRYINSYINSGFLYLKEKTRSKKFNLSYNFIKKTKKRVVTKKMTDDKKLICPICNKKWNLDENRSISIHIARSQDDQHQLLNQLKKENNVKNEELKELYNNNIDKFKKIENKENDNYLSIPCNCKISCKECYNNWKSDFYNDCNHDRKNAFIKEFKINTDSPDKITQPPIDKKKKKYKTNIPELVKYFYSLTGGTSPSFGKEIGQVKNLLNKGITPEQIKITMNYLHRKGNIDLRFLNRCVNEAIMEQKYIKQTEIKGTAPYLVKKYYDGLGLPLNMQTLNRDVQKIQETLNSGITYDQAEVVIQYMIDIKCPTINFIGSKITEALTKTKDKKNIKNNPAFFDRNDLDIIKNELINGRTNLNKINDKFKFKAKKIAKNILLENKFSNKYSAMEWIWKVGLDLDKEMYNAALNYQKNQKLTLDKILQDNNIPQEKRKTIINIKRKFEDWLDKQHSKFQHNHSQIN